MTDPDIEYFETFDDDGRPTGLVPRPEVHARGLWHRSAHVFLFTGAGELWIQRRAADKDLCPDRWDFSVGEHLIPGESYLAGALRGLKEELGLEGVALEAIGPVHRNRHRITHLGVFDREIQQAFRGRHDGPVRPDSGEVAEVATIRLAALAERIETAPEAFTPWFIAELNRLELLPRR